MKNWYTVCFRWSIYISFLRVYRNFLFTKERGENLILRSERNIFWNFNIYVVSKSLRAFEYRWHRLIVIRNIEAHFYISRNGVSSFVLVFFYKIQFRYFRLSIRWNDYFFRKKKERKKKNKKSRAQLIQFCMLTRVPTNFTRNECEIFSIRPQFLGWISRHPLIAVRNIEVYVFSYFSKCSFAFCARLFVTEKSIYNWLWFFNFYGKSYHSFDTIRRVALSRTKILW